MPVKSKAQMRLMRAAMGKHRRAGMPSKKVASEFIKATKSTRRLPERKKR